MTGSVALETQDDGNVTTADNQDTDITPEPNPIPENWKEWIPEDIRNTPVITETKDITAMAKRLVDSQKMIGSSMRMPEDGDTAGWDEVYGKLGRPEAVDGYKITRPDMQEGQQYDEKLEGSFLEAAHKMGLNSSQANQLIAWNQQQFLTQSQVLAEQAKDATSQLRQDWGTAFDERLEITERVVGQFGDGEVSAESIKDNPALIKMVYNMGKDLLESSAGGGGGPTAMIMSPTEAKAEIDKLNLDVEFKKAHNDLRHPTHQSCVDKMTDLYKMAYPEQE